MKCRHCGGSGKEPDWKKLGARIRRVRTDVGYTVRGLARKVGCSPAFVSDLETGKHSGGVTGPATARILDLLGIDP